MKQEIKHIFLRIDNIVVNLNKVIIEPSLKLQ